MQALRRSLRYSWASTSLFKGAPESSDLCECQLVNFECMCNLTPERFACPLEFGLPQSDKQHQFRQCTMGIVEGLAHAGDVLGCHEVPCA